MFASAFLVDADHIDALLTAGLAYARDLGPLTWYYPTPTVRRQTTCPIWPSS